LIINAIRIETMAMPRALFLRGLKVSTAAFLSESVIGRTDAENPGIPAYIWAEIMASPQLLPHG
jgi:hypothetical protein